MTAVVKWMALSLLVTLLDARAQEQPSETDLKAAYCVGVENETLKVLAKIKLDEQADHAGVTASERMAMKESAADRASELARSRRYIKGRMQYIDVKNLIVAVHIGETDVVELGKKFDSCSKQCVEGSSAPMAEVLQCMSICYDSTTKARRVKDCQEATWLPY